MGRFELKSRVVASRKRKLRTNTGLGKRLGDVGKARSLMVVLLWRVRGPA
jgi:hypothetical protein